jgi:hypothetical protein
VGCYFIRDHGPTKWVIPSMSALLVLMGVSTDENYPIFSPLVWTVAYTVVGLVWFALWLHPDRRKLRLAVVSLMAVGAVRAVGYLLKADDLYPAAANGLLIVVPYYIYYLLSRGLAERRS